MARKLSGMSVKKSGVIMVKMKAAKLYYNSVNVRSLIFSILMFIGSAGWIFAQDCPPPDDDDDDDDSNDPTFVFSDYHPGQSLQDRQNQLNQMNGSNAVALPTLGQAEVALLNDVTKKIKENSSDEALSFVMNVWRSNHSADLKRAVLLEGISKTNSTEQVQLMQFMMAALDNLKNQEDQIVQWGRGNGLEKQMATSHLLVLNQNPQTRLSD